MSGFCFNIQDVFNNFQFANHTAIQQCNDKGECDALNLIDNYWMTQDQFHDYLVHMFKANPGMNEPDNMTTQNAIDIINTAWMAQAQPYPMERTLNTKDLKELSIGLQREMYYWLGEYMNTYNAHHIQLEKNTYRNPYSNEILEDHDEERQYQEKMILCQSQMDKVRAKMASMGFVTELQNAIQKEFQGKLELVRGNANSAELIQMTYNQELYYTESVYDKSPQRQQCKKLAKEGTDGLSYQSTDLAFTLPRRVDENGNLYITDDEMCQLQLGNDYSNISLEQQSNLYSQAESPSYLCCGKDKQENARLVTVQGYTFYQSANGGPYYLVNSNKSMTPDCPSDMNIGNLAKKMGYVGNVHPEEGDPDEIGLDVDDEEHIDINDYPYKLQGDNCKLVEQHSVATSLKDPRIYQVSFSIFAIKVSKTFQQIQGLGGGYNPLNMDIGMNSGFGGSNSNTMILSTQDYYQPLQIVVEYKDHVKPPIVFTKSLADIRNTGPEETTNTQLQNGFNFINKVLCGPMKKTSEANQAKYEKLPEHKYQTLLLYHPSTDKFQVSEDFPHFRKDNYF